MVGGVPPLKISADWQWAVKNVPQLLRDLELTVYYNAEADEIDRAEFHNIVSPGSLITLTPGPVDIDPTLLDPDRWVTDHTMILTNPGQIKPGVTIVPNPFKMLLDLFSKLRGDSKDGQAGK